MSRVSTPDVQLRLPTGLADLGNFRWSTARPAPDLLASLMTEVRVRHAGSFLASHFHMALDSPEQNRNNVRLSFHPGEVAMFRAVVEEAAALASISLFIGMIAV